MCKEIPISTVKETLNDCNFFQTKKMYKWITPQICDETLSGSVSLPPSGGEEKCPPCNPGMESNDGNVCKFCPANFYSDGNIPCAACPANTAPAIGLMYKWWTHLPVNSNISTSCLSLNGKYMYQLPDRNA